MELVGSDYIKELQNFLASYDAETVKILQQISQNGQEEKELSKAQRQLDAYHRSNAEI